MCKPGPTYLHAPFLTYTHTTHHTRRLALARLILAVASKDRKRIVKCYKDMGACDKLPGNPIHTMNRSVDPTRDSKHA